MKSRVSAICAILGIGLAFTGSLAGLRTIWAGVLEARQVISLPSSDPTQLAAVIGEAIIAFVSIGFIVIIPAMLIFWRLAHFDSVGTGFTHGLDQLVIVYLFFFHLALYVGRSYL